MSITHLVSPRRCWYLFGFCCFWISFNIYVSFPQNPLSRTVCPKRSSFAMLWTRWLSQRQWLAKQPVFFWKVSEHNLAIHPSRRWEREYAFAKCIQIEAQLPKNVNFELFSSFVGAKNVMMSDCARCCNIWMDRGQAEELSRPEEAYRPHVSTYEPNVPEFYVKWGSDFVWKIIMHIHIHGYVCRMTTYASHRNMSISRVPEMYLRACVHWKQSNLADRLGIVFSNTCKEK